MFRSSWGIFFLYIELDLLEFAIEINKKLIDEYEKNGLIQDASDGYFRVKKLDVLVKKLKS